MKYNKFTVTLITSMLFTVYSCSDIIEKDISSESLSLYAPGNGMDLEFNTVNFIWDPIEGASNYVLQIAKPVFPAIYKDIVVDTNIIEVELEAGDYEWRVVAYNSNYSAKASEEWSFRITTTGSTDQPKIDLNVPVDGAILNDSNVMFQWNSDVEIEEYILKIFPGDILIETSEKELKHSLAFLDGEYAWQVSFMLNDRKVVSDLHSFTIDVAPLAPKLLLPVNERIMVLPFDMVWSQYAADKKIDSIYLYNSSLELMPDFPKMVENDYFSVDNTIIPVSGKYYWTVRSVDKSGNIGKVAEKFSFTIAP